MNLMLRSSCTILLLLAVVDCTVILTSNVTGASDQILCPSGVKFTCIARLEGQITIRWFIRSNGQPREILAQYTHLSGDAFPRTILATPKVVVFSSNFSTATSETTFNSTLEAKLSWFINMNINRIECGSYEEFESRDFSYSVRSHPQLPVYTCALVNNSFKSVEIIWDDNYNSVNDIDHYSIATSPFTNVSCYNALPTERITVNLVDGVYNSLNVTSFNCDDQAGEISNFGIDLHRLSAPGGIEVTALYNPESDIEGLELEWKQVDPVIISEVCGYNTSLYYEVIVEDHNKVPVSTAFVKSVECDSLCRIVINTTVNSYFKITLIAVNAVGQSRNTTYEVSIGCQPQNLVSNKPLKASLGNGSLSISGGQVQYSQILGGTVAIYQCNPGYTLSGNAYRVCRGNTNWTGSIPHCNRIPSTTELSQGASVYIALTAVICSALFLTIGCVLGMLSWYFITKYKRSHESNAIGDQAAAPQYEDVQEVPTRQAIALKENVAYVPTELKK